MLEWWQSVASSVNSQGVGGGKKLYDLKNGVKDASEVVVELFVPQQRCKKLVIILKMIGWQDMHIN